MFHPSPLIGVEPGCQKARTTGWFPKMDMEPVGRPETSGCQLSPLMRCLESAPLRGGGRDEVTWFYRSAGEVLPRGHVPSALIMQHFCFNAS